jgi:hypothetical protein
LTASIAFSKWLDREHRLLEITYANGDIGRAHFPNNEAMLEWVKHWKRIFREARFLGRSPSV